MSARVLPYGSWPSELSAAGVASGGVRLGQIQTTATAIWWDEQRPAEGGRTAVVRWTPQDGAQDAVGPEVGVRTRVHEYGGGAYAVHGDLLVYSDAKDQRLYRQEFGETPVPITRSDPPGAERYADMTFTPDGGRLVAVRERHGTEAEPTNEVVVLDAEGARDPIVVATGRDFYASPRPSPDGTQLAWLVWDHPDMPWDSTELWLADLTGAGVASPRRLGGGEGVSVFQPLWTPDGTLWCVADPGGWWNLHRATEDGLEVALAMEAEFGLPQWVFGMSTYAALDDGRLACAYQHDGRWRLGLFDGQELEPVEVPDTAIGGVQASGGRVVYVGGSFTSPAAIVLLDPSTGDRSELRSAARIDLDPELLASPEPVWVPGPHGDVHAMFYPPTHPDVRGPEDERPPVVVLSHGGPTSQARCALDLNIAYFTSRGFAVADVNYGGSVGFGRAYRERLRGGWGVVDVDDCAAVARSLADRGLVDPDRIVARGGSAGGYTTLCLLAFRDVLAAGASYYGVADLETLAQDTHKFEARYLDRLVGPYPEGRERYAERSPVHHAGGISVPVILFQGLDDPVVPPSQSEALVEALRAGGVPHAYLTFEDEQHGFRHAETTIRCLEAELAFYGEVLGFTPDDDLPPVGLSTR